MPEERVPNVTYVQGDATDESALAEVIEGADVVVGALSPRGALSNSFRNVYRTVSRLSNNAEAPLYIVGGFSSLRPAAGAPRFVEDLSHAPAELHNELLTVSALVNDDLNDLVTTGWAMMLPFNQRAAERSPAQTTPSGSWT